jgi:hypothetical protein
MDGESLGNFCVCLHARNNADDWDSGCCLLDIDEEQVGLLDSDSNGSI